MNFSAAFAALGYQVEQPRRDWSAASSRGVCISIWQKEIHSKGDGLFLFDTLEHGQDIIGWGKKPGNRKRIAHLARAIANHSGLVDVVVVEGEPGQGVKSAAPWVIDARNARWRVTSFDMETGHYRAELERL